jgi:peptidoglycan-associated lipoprotein
MKRTMTTALLMVLVCSFLVFVTACAKKQIQVSQPGKEMETPKEVKPEVTAPSKVEMKNTEEEEAKRRELEKAQMLANEMKMFESQSIYFDFDKSDLKPEAQATLKKKADWLRMNPGYSVRIEGNCDERGTNEYNLALGERRAASAKKFLAALGIAENRMSIISYGEERPVDPGHNEAAWAKNRRDDFRLIK